MGSLWQAIACLMDIFGSGSGSPSSSIASMWKLSASRIIACISSQVLPVLMQPGTSGT